MPLVRRAAVLLVLLALGAEAAAPAQAQPGSARTSFPFLRLDPSARAAALGGAFAAVADGDVDALFYNPAVAGPATSRSVSATYVNHLADINAGSVAYTHTVRGIGTTLSGGVRFMHWGTFERRDRYGVPDGTFRAGDVALTVGAARPLGARWRYGATVHVLHSAIETARATALAADVGLLYRWPDQQLTAAASLRHMATVLEPFGAAGGTTLPADLQVGVTKRLAHLPLLLSVSAYDLTHLDEGVAGGTTLDHVLAHLSMGAELQLGSVLRVRLGYSHRRSEELALADRFDFAGIGTGFGVRVGEWGVDYAYSSWSSLGALHQFTLSTDV
jgi:hypothetical protein